jgi:hypothetical protein
LRDAAAWFSLAVVLLSLTQATISGIAGCIWLPTFFVERCVYQRASADRNAF